jgi:hypothetical protein
VVSPSARIRPTRLPWWWPLAACWPLVLLWSPAFAFETDRLQAPMANVERADGLRLGQWQWVPAQDMWRAVQGRSDVPASRMLPLAVMPAQRSALWLGLGASRSSGARLELRWTIPLDGSAPVTRSQ